MKRSIARALFLAAAASSLLLAGCDTEFGIFKSIQEEVKQVGTFDARNVAKVVLFDNRYWVAAKGLYVRTALSKWDVSSAYEATDIAATGSSLYLCADGNVFQSNATATSWTLLNDPSFSGMHIDALFSVNGDLFLQHHQGYSTASDATDDRFTLYHLNGAALEGTGIANLTDAIVGADGTGTDYWFAAGTQVFHGASATTLAAVATAPAVRYTSLALGLTGQVNAGRVDGKVSTYNGASWSANEVEADEAIRAIVLAGNRLLFSRNTSSLGYEEVDASAWLSVATIEGDDASALLTGSSGTNYATTLKTLPINSFFWDGTGNILFACAAAQNIGGSGLWSNEYNGTAWAGWKAE